MKKYLSVVYGLFGALIIFFMFELHFNYQFGIRLELLGAVIFLSCIAMLMFVFNKNNPKITSPSKAAQPFAKGIAYGVILLSILIFAAFIYTLSLI